MNIKKTVFWQLCFCAFLFVVDRITKWYALNLIAAPWQVNNFLSFEILFNRGISWGMFDSSSMLTFVIVTLMVVLLIGLFISHTVLRFYRNQSIIGELMVITGALSNLLDRIVYQGVIDFILLSLNGWSWPVFNVADVCIVIGIGIIFLQSYKNI